MTLRCALYARYSSDQQRAASGLFEDGPGIAI